MLGPIIFRLRQRRITRFPSIFPANLGLLWIPDPLFLRFAFWGNERIIFGLVFFSESRMLPTSSGGVPLKQCLRYLLLDYTRSHPSAAEFPAGEVWGWALATQLLLKRAGFAMFGHVYQV